MLCIYSFGLLLLFAKLFPKLNPLAYWNIKKELQTNFIKGEAKQISITQDEIAIASPNFRQYYQWQAITKTAENNNIFLLYHSQGRECTIIPKRILTTEAELVDFRQLVNNRAG